MIFQVVNVGEEIFKQSEALSAAGVRFQLVIPDNNTNGNTCALQKNTSSFYANEKKTDFLVNPRKNMIMATTILVQTMRKAHGASWGFQRLKRMFGIQKGFTVYLDVVL